MLCLLLLLLLNSALAETIKVEFQPEDKTRELSGNLIVVLSERKMHPSGPGLMTVYSGGIRVKSNLTLKAGDRVTVELGDVGKAKFAGVYFDENQNFMWRGLLDDGEFSSSGIVELGTTNSVALDRVNRSRRHRSLGWLQDQAILSPRLLAAGFTREESTLRYLVGLPPGYWQSEREYPVVYISHGFNGDRWSYIKRYKIWREQMRTEPMILVSLDSYGRYGHHLFLNSQGNGPRFDVLTKELIPDLERRYRTNGKRILYGQSSGGWTAISLLRQAPELFTAAVATGPDPLILERWWMDENQNMYVHPDGSERYLVPAIKLTMKAFVGQELATESFGQFAGFLAAFSPLAPESDGYPFLSPFDLKTGQLQEDVWALWQDHDQGVWVTSHPDEARQTFADRLVLIVGNKDEFGLWETTRGFSKVLDSLSIPHRYWEIEGAGHTNYLERPKFVAELWSTFYALAQ